MTVLSQTGWLLSRELRQELRRKHVLGSIFLHALTTVFVCYMSFVVVTATAWNALFWVILLFATVNATAKSFINESPGRQLYLYQLASPAALILSKLIYNSLLIIVITLISFGFYYLFIGSHAQETAYYLLSILLSSIGFSGIFTLVSALASKTNNASMLMPVLSFPILLPLILVGISASKKAMDGIILSRFYQDLIVLSLLDIMIVLLCVILFRFLWRE